MPHQRHIPQDSRIEGSKKPSGSTAIPKVSEDLRAINSSILIILQKIKFLVRNEKILGRNLLVVNRKVKDLQESGHNGPVAGTGGMDREIASLNSKVAELSERITLLGSEVENIRQNYAKAEQVSEIKYVIDSINPLEFATLKDLKENGAAQKQKKK
ncbi:MAG TPA: hypothetical protein HA254_07205 [Candidatus Diapherotrites archaeon]|uniref:Uncharacterized protein n=1 Tax=Candidatus Iainarchaeum sp. TaxID=3101447 RepID=A0A7J4IY07_9ARCH|nr:hypothetical protein [Candidatus Diapherotrites archaeon]